MIEYLILAIQFFTLLNLAESREKKEDKDRDVGTDDRSDYQRGREWACEEFYKKGRPLEEMKEIVCRSYNPTDFERGALETIKELERRYEIK